MINNRKFILIITPFLLVIMLAGITIDPFRALIYQMDARRVTPKQVKIPAIHEVVFKTKDRKKIILWVAPPKNKTKATILYFHGNAGNLASRSWRIRKMVKEGYGFIGMSYRGSNGSTGKPTEKSIISDAIQVFDTIPTLLKNTPYNGRVIVYGESLGTGVATALGSQRKLRGMILQSPFTTMLEVAQIIAKKKAPSLPIDRYWKDHWDSRSRIKAYHGPLLIMHGVKDPLIPYSQGVELYNIANKPKELRSFKEGGHNNLWQLKAWRDVSGFIKKVQ